MVKFIAGNFADVHFSSYAEVHAKSLVGTTSTLVTESSQFSPLYQNDAINSWKHNQIASLTTLVKTNGILETFSLFYIFETLARWVTAFHSVHRFSTVMVVALRLEFVWSMKTITSKTSSHAQLQSNSYMTICICFKTLQTQCAFQTFTLMPVYHCVRSYSWIRCFVSNNTHIFGSAIEDHRRPITAFKVLADAGVCGLAGKCVGP